MNVSRFFGATNREAMRQVRMALGPDALIISNRRVNGGVEIMAADQTSVGAATDDGLSRSSAPSGPVMAPTRTAPMPAAPSASPADVMQALGSMRGLLESGFDELMWGAQLRKAPQAVTLFQKLLALGFSTALLRAMLKRLPQVASARVALQWCRDELTANLPVMTNEDELWAPGTVLALVGPTGVGKTTTVAKLAARGVRRFGPSNLLMITTDTYRIGAHEQLKIYGRMMRVPVHVAQDRSELIRLLATASPDARVLIDNVGLSQRDRHVREQAAMLCGLPRPVKRLLVLNAASQGDTLDEVARAYTQDGGSPLIGCLVSKLDESPRVAPALDIAIRYQLPIHYACTGQKVPEDLVHMDAASWVEQALLPAQPASALFSASAADLAALMEIPSGTTEPQSQKSGQPAAAAMPSLMALMASSNGALDHELLRKACDELDTCEAYTAAYQHWRRLMSLSDRSTSWTPLAAARQELALHGQDELLALHDAVSMMGKSAAQKLQSTVLLGGRGRALTTPWQQWSVGTGWQASDGTSQPDHVPRSRTLAAQIRYLNSSADAAKVIHLFSFPGQTLVRELCSDNIHWLAACPGTTKIETESGATTMAAYGKTLDYRCLDSATSRLELSRMQGVALRDVALWAGESAVTLALRGSPGLDLRQVSLRLIDRRNGKTLKTLHGLSNVSLDRAQLDALAGWLTVQAEVKNAARHLPSLWSLQGAPGRVLDSGVRSAAAVQLALAVWQAPRSSAIWPAMTAISGAANLGTAAAQSQAMCRLFALKNLLESQ